MLASLTTIEEEISLEVELLELRTYFVVVDLSLAPVNLYISSGISAKFESKLF